MVYLTDHSEDSRCHTFPWIIGVKVNVLEHLEFELTSISQSSILALFHGEHIFLSLNTVTGHDKKKKTEFKPAVLHLIIIHHILPLIDWLGINI